MKAPIFFPKKSSHGYYDDALKVRFNTKTEKREYLKKHGFVETEPASSAHMKRVKDFSAWIKDEKRKNPKFEPRGEAYPT